MSTTAKIWIPIGLVYALFFGWYTSFGGPLTDEEIARYTAFFEARAEDGDASAWIRFMETDTGDDFVMQNAIDFRETPQRIEGVGPDESSADVMARYAEPFLGKALRRASHPVLLGTVAAPAIDMWGIDAPRWDQGGLVRYRSRRDVVEQAVSIFEEGHGNIHDFKIAAMEKTIAFPLDPWFHLGDPRLLLALVLAVIGLALQLRAATARARAS